MLVNCDIRGLEVVVAAQLSGDKTLQQEILNGVDIHETNRDAFSLGEGKAGRLVAKVLKFRLIYGGGAYAFANDPLFQAVSSSQKFWEEVIETYYNKYKGIAKWHKDLILEAQTHGKLTLPNGRYYPIVPDYTKKQPWPITIIKNYPVQGFGADCVMLARLRAAQLISRTCPDALLVGTVHDSIVCDCKTVDTQKVGRILLQSIEEIPKYVKHLWGYDFTLPLTGEVTYGQNKTDMETLVFE